MAHRTLLMEGAQAAWARWWLVALVYGVSAAISLATAFLLVAPMQEVVGSSGFAVDLAGGFDLALWADILEESGAALWAQRIHLLWIVPASIVWKAAASVGLLHALKGPAGSFWRGSTRYVFRSLLLGAIFLCTALILAGLAVAVVLAVGQLWSGEVGRFWVWLVFAPGAAAIVVSACTVMRDVARAVMVVGEQSIFAAMGSGFTAPFRRRGVWVLFVVCVVIGGLLAGTSVLLESNVTAATLTPMTGLLAAQQVIQILIAAVIVVWYGSLAAYVQAAWAAPPARS